MRRIYFSFDYERDLERVRKIRDVPGMLVGSAAGFHSDEVWRAAQLRGDKAIEGMIRDALNNTSVTVVCLGHLTGHRKYVNYEIEESLRRGNGLVAIQIHQLANAKGETDTEGPIPPLIKIAGYKTYRYSNKRYLAEWIEQAAEVAAEIAQREHRRKLDMKTRD